MPQIFVSYRRKDSSTTTGRLIDRLKTRFPTVDIFHDVKSIPAGIDFKEYTNQKVKPDDIFLIIIGPAWLETLNDRIDDEDFVRDELELALSKECKMLPIYVNDAKPPAAKDLPDHLSPLAYINGLPLRTDPDFENDLGRIEDFLDKEIALRTTFIEKTVQKVKKFDTKLLFSIIGGIVLLFFIGSRIFTSEAKCDSSKIQTIIANFSEDKTDGFSNTLIAKLDQTLPDSTFNVSGCDFQNRNIENYKTTIEDQYFKRCDLKGLFVNGFRDESEKVFNFYVNNIGLKLNAPKYLVDNAIILAELEEATFTVAEDSKIIHNYIELWLSYYLDDSKTFIKNSYQFQQDHELTQKNIKNNAGMSNLLAMLYLMRADHYAMEGNEKTANQYYDYAIKLGNDEVKEVAKVNRSKAQPIADVMYLDEDLRKLRAANVVAHGKIENGFEKFLKEVGKVFKSILNTFGIK